MKKKAKKKRKITPLQSKLKKLVADYIKLRDKYTCQRCLKTPTSSHDMHASHVIPTSKSLLLRFDPENLKMLCYHCHLEWWHKNPLEAAEWFKGYSPERYEYLWSKKELYAKYIPEDYDAMILEAEIRLKSLQDERNNNENKSNEN